MALFSSEKSEKESMLERALDGIPFSGNIDFLFCDKDGNPKAGQAYVLKVGIYDDSVFGFFDLEDLDSEEEFKSERKEAKLGFLRKKNFSEKEYYSMTIDGTVQDKSPREDVLYLPVRMTEDFIHLNKEGKGKFPASAGPLCSIVGIESFYETHPLLFAYESENGVLGFGVALNPEGKLETYPVSMRENEMGSFLRTFQRSGVAGVEDLFVRSRDDDDDEKDEEVEEPKKQKTSTTSVKPSASVNKKPLFDLESPQSIVKYLDQFVVGQDRAKKSVAVSFASYMTRFRTKNDLLPKDNLLLIGPSGVGKSYMISLLAKEASIPFVWTKLTGKSAEGFKGESLSCIFDSIKSITKDKEPYVIVFTDEIDKTIRDEHFGSRIQNELIGWTEESVYEKINTKNLFFVAAGAFRGEGTSLEQIIGKRLSQGKQKIGFTAVEVDKNPDSELLYRIRPEDLVEYGLKPELVGRFPSIGVLNELTIENKISILAETRQSTLVKHLKLFSERGYEVNLEEEVYRIIAELCPKETGARALNSLCHNLFTEILFDPSAYATKDKKINVDGKLARKLLTLYH